MPHKDKEERKAYLKKYRQTDRGRELNRLRQLRYAHTENGKRVLRASWKRWRLTEKGIANRSTRYQRYKDGHYLIYRKSPRGKMIASINACKRRARIKKATISFTVTDWLEILRKYDYRCAYCGTGGVPLEQEHYIPLAKGGSHTKENIVPACRRCNATKFTRKGNRLFL